MGAAMVSSTVVSSTVVSGMEDYPLPRAQQRRKHAGAVGRAKAGMDGALGMWHQAEHVARAVADAGDGVHRAIGVGTGVAEDDLVVGAQVVQRGGVGIIGALTVGDRQPQDLAGVVTAGERR